MFILTRHTPSPIPVELFGVIPGRVDHFTALDLAKLPVQHGNRQEELGQFFDVIGNPNRRRMVFVGDNTNIKGIGAGMADGMIRVDGDVGMHAGAGMTGGRLVVEGSADDWLGAEMRGGSIEVRHSAGNRVGAAYVGSRHGMTGGTIRVRGSVGHETGLLMRRGTIIVAGDTGEFAGASMIAGTIVVNGTLGARAGAGMKRGTILALGGVTAVSPGHRYSCEYAPTFLPLLLRSLELEHRIKPVKCYRGDVLTGGRGELLVASVGGLS